jgi:pimeloyl-ACP methyl ester carboxylesterase
MMWRHGLRQDLGCVVVFGHSAGGLLALWAAQAHRSPLVRDPARFGAHAVGAASRGRGVPRGA